MAVAARVLIAEAARHNDWTAVGAPAWCATYRRGLEHVTLRYSRNGAILTAVVNGEPVTGPGKRAEVLYALQRRSTDPEGLAIQVRNAEAKALAREAEFGPSATTTRNAWTAYHALAAALARAA